MRPLWLLGLCYDTGDESLKLFSLPIYLVDFMLEQNVC